MRNRSEVQRAIDNVLIPYADCVAWSDLCPNGSLCEDADTLAAVHLEMKKGSRRHMTLSELVAAQTGNKYVTYPWLRDAVTRLLSGVTYNELLRMAMLSRMVKAGMKAKGLTRISSIEEALR